MIFLEKNEVFLLTINLSFVPISIIHNINSACYGSIGSNNDDVGKTVAIIVGVVAGIAVFIVLLSFCRKACH